MLDMTERLTHFIVKQKEKEQKQANFEIMISSYFFFFRDGEDF